MPVDVVHGRLGRAALLERGLVRAVDGQPLLLAWRPRKSGAAQCHEVHGLLVQVPDGRQLVLPPASLHLRDEGEVVATHLELLSEVLRDGGHSGW